MSRRGSSSSVSSESDVTNDDQDDFQVDSLLQADGTLRSSKSSSPRSKSQSENLCLELSLSASKFVGNLDTPVKALSCSLKTLWQDPHFDVKTTKSDFAAMYVIHKLMNESKVQILSGTPFHEKSSVKEHQPMSSSSLSQNALSIHHLDTGAVPSRYESDDFRRFDDATKPQFRSIYAVDSDNKSKSVAGYATVQGTTLTSLKAQVKQLTCEKTQLEVKAITTGSTIVHLEQKLTVSKQSKALLTHQLANLKESFQAKLMAREEERSIEELTQAKDKETLCQDQLARYATEVELWKREIAALTKVLLDLKGENNRLQMHSLDQERQRQFLEANHRTLVLEHASTCDELRQENERHESKIQALRSTMASDTQEQARLRQQLKAQVHTLLLDREVQHSKWDHKSLVSCCPNGREPSKLVHSIHEIRGLHSLLHLSLVETRNLLKMELQKTFDVFTGILQQVSDFANHQSGHAMFLIPLKGQTCRPKTQSGSRRQLMSQFKETMAKSARLFEKKHKALKAKYREQTEHLTITLAVCQGLTTDLQAKRKQVGDLKREVARLQLAESKTDVKLKQSHQQMIAIQKAYTREVEKLDNGSSIVSKTKKTNHVPSPLEFPHEANSETKISPHDGVEESEWQEFVELVAAYEAERQL